MQAQATDLSIDMLKSDKWEQLSFKPYNFQYALTSCISSVLASVSLVLVFVFVLVLVLVRCRFLVLDLSIGPFLFFYAQTLSMQSEGTTSDDRLPASADESAR